MNTYRVIGTYRLWEDPKIGRTNFERVVLANNLDEALSVCAEEYAEAEVETVLMRDKDVLVVFGTEKG